MMTTRQKAILLMLIVAGQASAADNRAVASGRQDIVYLAPATEPYEAMPLGNGNLGVMLSNERGMSYKFNPGSFFASADQNQHLYSSGMVDLQLPEAWKKGFVEQRLTLFDGTIVTEFKTGQARHRITSWIVDGLDLLIVKIDSDEALPTFKMDLWLHDRSKIPCGYGPPPPVKAAMSGNEMSLVSIGLSRRRATCLLVSPWDGKATVTQVDPLRLSMTLAADGRKTLILAMANPVTFGNPATSEQALEAARAVLAKARKTGESALRQAHDDYWHTFWNKSMILLRSDDGLAEFSENLYYFFLYQMAGCSRGKEAPKFNGGNYTFYEDLRSWGGQYWYQNTRELFWALLPADHPELWTPFIDLYVRNLPAARTLAREMYGYPGACYEETMGRDGSGDKRSNPYTTLYVTTGTEMACQLYRFWLYNRDDTYLREKAYPVMKDVLAYHCSFLRKKKDGNYHVYPSNARETYWWIEDSISCLAALRTALPYAIAASEHLGIDEELRDQWKDFLANLAPLVTKDGLYAPGTAFPQGQWPPSGLSKVEAVYTPDKRTARDNLRTTNCENETIEPVYPWGLFGLHSPPADLERMRATFAKRPNYEWTFGNAWDWSLPAAARLGLPAEAVKCLRQYVCNIQEFPAGFSSTPAARPDRWGKMAPDSIALDSSGVLAAGVQEMLLQSYSGRIRVFACMPKGWRGEFTLAAEGGFLVSSRLQADGGIPFITLVSRRGGPCAVVNPWQGEARLETGGKSSPLGAAAEFFLETQAGETYELRPHQAVTEAAPISTTRNIGPKWPFHEGADDTAEAYLKRHSGYGFLGITRDGQNPMRNKVKMATGEDVYPNPPKRLLAADFDTSLDAAGAAGPIPAEGNGAKRMMDGGAANKKGGGVVDLGYSGNERALLKYSAKGNLDPRQGTLAFWVKTAWDWDPQQVKASQNLVTIPLGTKSDKIAVNAYMHPDSAFVGFYVQENDKLHASYFRVAWKKDEWHHLAATWNGWRTRLFVDGKRVDNAFWGDTRFQLRQTPEWIMVGPGDAATPRQAKGIRIDDLQIWDQPLRNIVK